MTRTVDTRVLIAGAGIGGLTTALALHQRGIDCRIVESARELRPLGVGINVLPHAVRVLDELGATSGFADACVQTGTLMYTNRHGQEIWSEPRGRAAGYAHPQFSIHRGLLQMHLLGVVTERLGPDAVITGRALAGWSADEDSVRADLVDHAGQPADALSAELLIGADGINSTARRMLHPNDGGVHFSGRLMWRGVTRARPFLDARTMVMIGTLDTKFVCYPITPVGDDGLQDLNWVAERMWGGAAPPPQDWSRIVAPDRFRAPFAAWTFSWIDVPALIDGAPAVYEYPMSDRNPLDRWGDSRVTLLGDAAHPMYPIGSNGASQAILDAICLAEKIATHGTSPDALQVYDDERRPLTSAIVLSNRQGGPERVMQIAEERAPEGFAQIEDVIPRAELEAIAAQYKQTAGFTVTDVNR